MKEDQIIMSEPEKIKGVIISEPEEIKDDDYVYADCKCPVLMNYGIKIVKRQKTAGQHKEYRYKCKKCGLEGVIIV